MEPEHGVECLRDGVVGHLSFREIPQCAAFANYIIYHRNEHFHVPNEG